MVYIAELRPGNWIKFDEDNQYCKVQSIEENITISDYLGTQRICEPSELSPIRLIPYHYSLAGFRSEGPYYIKVVKSMKVAISFDDNVPHIIGMDGKKRRIEFVHLFQNHFQDITGFQVDINLIGAPSS